MKFTLYTTVPYKRTITLLLSATILFCSAVAQKKDSVMVSQIMKEANEPQLKKMAHELFDIIGPRLVGTPQMKQANDWAVNHYKKLGIDARNEKWGEWRGWERGVSHIDLVHPRVRSLEGMILAWSPGTKGKTVTAETVIIPDVTDSLSFQKWLPAVKGKFVLMSMEQPTGRPNDNWEQFGLKESVEKMKQDRSDQTLAWAARIRKTGLNTKNLALALENAGAAGLIQSNWSQAGE